MRSGSTLLGVVLLTGCASVPDYSPPDGAVIDRPSASAPFRSGAEPSFVQADPPPHWWRLYHDDRLDGLVAEALSANADLRAADANLRRAAFVVQEVAAGRTVQTGVSGGLAAERRGSPAPGSDVAYAVGIDARYELDLAGRIRRAVEAATADAEAAAAARDAVRVIVAALATRSYATACSANVALEASRRVLGVRRRTLSAILRLKVGGRATAFDVSRAATAVHQSEAALSAIVARRQAALYELGAILGRPPADYPREVEACPSPPLIRAPMPVGDGAGLLRRRPDLREAERSLAAAGARVGVAAADLYPRIGFGGSLGAAGPLGGLLGNDALSGSIGPLLSWTWPNRRAVRARIGQAQAAGDAAAARFDDAVIEALRQTETALSAYARQLDRNAALLSARSDAERAVAQAERLFRFGRTGVLDLLASQASLAEAETALAQSRADVVDRQIDVFLALGGGWEP